MAVEMLFLRMVKDDSSNLQTTEYEDWEEIGRELKRINQQVSELSITLGDVPKSVWNDDVTQAADAISSLKDNLEERMFKEHPEKADTDVFYGPPEEDGD